MCVCLFLVRRWDPVAERQIWNGAWSSILVYQLQCYSQPVRLSASLFVCLSACLPSKETKRVGVSGGLLLPMTAKNKHTHHTNIEPEVAADR